MTVSLAPLSVGIAELEVGQGDLTLVTTGLGSCVAVALYDASTQVGALAHVLLPHAALSSRPPRAGKFPSTAVPVMLERMRDIGARGEIHARLIGGASMFGALLPAGAVGLGVRNVKAARQACAAHDVPVVGEAVGGTMGRSLTFDLATGRIVVRSVRGDDVVL